MAKRRVEPRVLDDPRAIRALAHPARLAALTAFGGGTELTATQVAEQAGVSPSAMSYHLRELEKWGIVERVESTSDGRERPWRAYPGGFRTEALPAAAAATPFTKLLLGRVAEELGRFNELARDQSPSWQSAAGFINAQAWLTADEVEQLRQTIDEWIDERRHRTAVDHPPDTRRVRLVHISVPNDLGA